MPCPYFQDKCICAAEEPDLYVPPKEVEFAFCRTNHYAGCEIYRRVTGQSEHARETVSKAPGGTTVTKSVHNTTGSSHP